MRRGAIAAGGAMALGLGLLLLAGCPSLSAIGGGLPDATAEHVALPPVEVGVDARADTADDAPVDELCDANVGSDPHNCGSCRHDCLGGGCADGACEPVVLYSGPDTPSGIVVDGPTVLVTVQTTDPNGGYLFRCTTTDCMSTRKVIATGLVNPETPVTLAATLYWANGGNTSAPYVTTSGTVTGCPEQGCPDSGPVVYVPLDSGIEGGATIGAVAADGTYLYWSFWFGPSSAVSGAVYQCATADCPGTPTRIYDGPDSVPFAIAVESDFVYWTDFGMSQVLRCALPCGGSPNIFAVDQTNAAGLALYGDHVYWTQGIDDGDVLECPASGCGAAPGVIASGLAAPLAVVVDDSGVYWTDSDDGTVMRCPIAGCSKPTTIARTHAAYAIALDPVSVYFTDSSALGAVLRVAK